MEITISIQELVLLILGIAAIVLLFYLIGLIKNLIETVKHANKVLEDTEIITSVAAEKAQELDGVIDDAVSSISAIGEIDKRKSECDKGRDKCCEFTGWAEESDDEEKAGEKRINNLTIIYVNGKIS